MRILNNVERTTELSKEKIDSYALSWLEDTSSNIYTVWNSEGKLIHVTDAIQRILGICPNFILGKKWNELITHIDYESIKSNYEASKNNETPHYHIKFENHKGEEEWFFYSIKEINNNDEKFYAIMFEHLNNKENYDHLVVQSEKMAIAGQLAAGIVHEIRNPLTSIKGFVQLLQSGVMSKPAYFDIMINEIETMEAMATELLFIAKPLTDEKQLESINSMIDETILLLNSQAFKCDIEIEYNPGIDYKIICNRSQLKQVLVNLIKNAIEAIKTNGTIKIETKLEDNNLLIDIHDDGPGIPSELIETLEEPFFTTKQEGTGLGLMITKELLNYHNGKLLIKSKLNYGSTFSLCLPYSNK